jgi:ankyrin repeat protein
MAVADMASENLELARLLIAHGANVNARHGRTGQTALMWAAVRGDLPMATALVAAGADIRATTVAGSTPLHFAVQQGALPVAQLLLDAGADPNATMTARQVDQEAQAYGETLTGVTPLWLATTIRHEALGALLLDRGANPNAGQYRGIPPLHFAVQGRMDTLTKALLAHGAHVNARAPHTASPPKGGDENLIGHKTFYLMPVGATPFYLAAQIRDPNAMRTLLAAGADPAIPDDDATTPLMAAAGVTDPRFRQPTPRRRASPEEILESVTLALTHGNAVNDTNDLNMTALHGAAALRTSALVQLLLDRGAKPGTWSTYGQRPLEVAERDGRFVPDPAQRTQVDTILELLRSATPDIAPR